MAGLSPIAVFNHKQFDLRELRAAKYRHQVSVCLPARNEAGTVARIVEQMVGHPLVDEVVVVDDHSDDGTAAVAQRAGARVVEAATFLADIGAGPGKGQAVWKAIAASTGDIVAFCDADLRDFSPRFIVGLVGPLLLRPDLHLVKAFYDRPGDGRPRGGGRVTELVARPLLHLFFPELAPILQPLAGEFAARRQLLESLAIVGGYGVDIALLIDAADRVGVASLAQVDLGRRVHRNRPLAELSPMAAAVAMAALRRVGAAVPSLIELAGPDFEAVAVEYVELPPLATLTVDRRRRAS